MNTEHISKVVESLDENGSILSSFHADEETPFPLDALPENLRRVAKSVSDAYQAPIDLVAPQTLAVVSSCLGKGISLKTNYPDPTYGLLYMFLATRAGVSKSSILKFLMSPLKAKQREERQRYRASVQARIIEEKREQKKNDSHPDWQPTQKQINEEIGKSSPTLIAEHYSQEGLATTLSHNNEFLSLISTDASGVVDLLCGAKTNGTFQGEILLKGYSGESYDCNNKVAADEHLEEIRLNINWLGTIDTLKLFISNKQIKGRGLLSRFCFAEIDEPIPLAEVDCRKVEDDIENEWSDLIEGLSSKFWRRKDGEVINVQMSHEAIQASVDFRNEYVNEQESLAWLDSLPDRWRENAFRFALVLHVCKFPNNPEGHVLDLHTMQDAIRIMRWFIGREMASIGEVKACDPAVMECKVKVFEYLRENGPTSMRDLKRKSSVLNKACISHLKEWIRRGELFEWNASKGGKASPKIAIPEDDRIPKDISTTANSL